MSPDEVEPSMGGIDDQTDAIPTSSSSDSLSMSDEPDARASLPTPSDILVSYSTFPGVFFFCFITAPVCILSNNTDLKVRFRTMDRFDLCISSLHHFEIVMNTGYVSWRDTQAGSWYVETLDRILEENADTDDLVTMLMMVRFSIFSKICLVFIDFPI